MDSWTDGIEFERLSPLRKTLKAAIINPVANYFPAGAMRWVLRVTKSELAKANWADPGGWRSMTMSYDGSPRQIADKVLINAGTMSMALRNRRKLAARVLCRLFEQVAHEPVHVLGLGAGCGHNVTDAICVCQRHVRATLVDISSDAFEEGRKLAASRNLSDRVRFVQEDIRNIEKELNGQVDIVKMLGICEYIPDADMVSIMRAVAEVMPSGSLVVYNSLSQAHGTDRFFRRVFGLNMIHRSAAQLQALFEPLGFCDFQAIAEPLGVYEIVIARKK